VSVGVEPDEGSEDDGPLLPWISPDDRLWRHPSEMGSSRARPPATHRGGRSGGVRLWSVAVAAGVVGAVLASGVGIATGSFVHRTTVLSPVTRLLAPSSMPVTTGVTSSTATAPNWPAIADDVAPSVVTITASGPAGEQVGSGVLYTSIGDKAYILTAGSLIGGDQLKVTFDDSEVQAARIVGIDHQTGLGLISVPGGKRDFPPFASETSLQVAQPVMGIGARAATGAPNVSTGSISALDVAVDTGDESTMENLIGISSSEPVADLGAALVDPQGAVFGIEASVDTPDATQAGQTFAVPYDVADHVARQMLAGVNVTHPWLGVVNAKDPSSATASQLSLAGGSQVTQVSPGSPAERAGLRPSDIITAFDGHPVASTGALTSLVCDSTPGQPATVTYIHQGQTRSATVTLEDTPSDVTLTAGTGS
jgi:putative serine protease PepD